MSTSAERMRRKRARDAGERRLALLPAPGAAPRDPDELLLPSVEASIGALGLGEADRGIAQLARALAAAIDGARDQAAALRVLGPELRKVIEAAGGTPASRARMPQGKAPRRPAPSGLARLRDARA